jgi:hypothetical protein
LHVAIRSLFLLPWRLVYVCPVMPGLDGLQDK